MLRLGERIVGTRTSVEERDVMPALERDPHRVPAEEVRSAEEEDLHARSLRMVTRGDAASYAQSRKRIVHGDKELAEKLGDDQPLPVRIRPPLSSSAAVDRAAFDLERD